MICQVFFENNKIGFRRLTSKYPDLRYRETLLSITPQAQVIGEGSSGIALFATVLGDKNADCHTPPAVLLRGGSIRLATCSCQAGRCYRLSQLSVKGKRSAVTPWVSLIGRVCRSASLPLTLILYHTLRQKSIGFEKFFMNFLYFLYEQIMNCGIGIYGAPFKQLKQKIYKLFINLKAGTRRSPACRAKRKTAA